MMEQWTEPSLIDRCSTDEGERRCCLHSESDVISSIVQNKEGTRSLGLQVSEKKERTRSAINSEATRTEIKDQHADKIAEESCLCKNQSAQNKDVIQSRENGTNSRRHLYSGRKQELGEEIIIQYESGFSNPAHSSLHHRTLNIERSDMCNESKSNLPNGECHTCQTNELWNRIQYPCTKCEKRCNLKASLIRHQRKCMLSRSFQCAQCQQSFKQKADLSRHQQTHIGTQLEATKPIREKPFQCINCKKSFIYYGYLVRHLKMHCGLTSRETTHQGTPCKISLREMGNSVGHHRVQKGLRSYEYTECERSCSQNTDRVLQPSIGTGQRTGKPPKNMVRLLEISVPNDYFLRQHGEDDHYQISEDAIRYK